MTTYIFSGLSFEFSGGNLTRPTAASLRLSVEDGTTQFACNFENSDSYYSQDSLNARVINGGSSIFENSDNKSFRIQAIEWQGGKSSLVLTVEGASGGLNFVTMFVISGDRLPLLKNSGDMNRFIDSVQNFSASHLSIVDGQLFDFTSLESYIGNSNNDVFSGGTAVSGTSPNRINSGIGDDTLCGGGLADTLSGGDGNDYIAGFNGSDLIYGGAGNDEMVGGNSDSSEFWERNAGASLVNGNDKFYAGNGNDVVLAGVGDDLIYGGEGNDRLDGGSEGRRGSEDFYGEFYRNTRDTIFGGNGNDTIEGQTGSDLLFGDGGADTLSGGDGGDTLTGGGAIDILYGGNGGDIIAGGIGRDSLFGGGGADEFKFISVRELAINSRATDTIFDFTTGSDMIDLSSIDANRNSSGDDAFAFSETRAFGTSVRGEVNYKIYDFVETARDYTLVFIDTDADSSAEAVILLTGVHRLTAGDFIL